MGRLIDADHLLFLLNSAIELRKKLHRNTSDLDMMVDAVNNEPTAYDTNKVIEQLEEMRPEEDCFDDVEDYKYALNRHNKIIELVKAGGADA